MNYSIAKHAFENRQYQGGGGGTCYSPPRRIVPKPSVSGIAHGVGIVRQASIQELAQRILARGKI